MVGFHFIFGILGGWVFKPLGKDWIAVKGLMRYINATKNVELILASDNENQIKTSGDSNKVAKHEVSGRSKTMRLVMYDRVTIYATS